MLIDGQQVQGIEPGASGALNDRWSIVATYAWQDGQMSRRRRFAGRAM